MISKVTWSPTKTTGLIVIFLTSNLPSTTLVVLLVVLFSVSSEPATTTLVKLPTFVVLNTTIKPATSSGTKDVFKVHLFLPFTIL